MLLIPSHGMQRQAGLCEIKAIVVYRGSFRRTRAVTQKKIPVLKKKEFLSLTWLRNRFFCSSGVSVLTILGSE